MASWATSSPMPFPAEVWSWSSVICVGLRAITTRLGISSGDLHDSYPHTGTYGTGQEDKEVPLGNRLDGYIGGGGRRLYGRSG